MSINLPDHFVKQYASTILLLLQQKDSRLSKAVTHGTYKGEQASPVDQFGAVEMQPVLNRYTPITRVDAAVDRRWVSPSDFDLAQLIDSFDKLKLLNDPTSIYSTNAMQAAGRQKDRMIIAAMNGANYTGKAGTTSTALPSGQKIATSVGGSNTNLNVAKLREARRLMMFNNVDMEAEKFFIAVNSKAHDALLKEAQVISLDFTDKPVLQEGRITRFLGFDFIHTELLETSSTSDYIPAWAMSGVHLGVWEDMKIDISIRNDLTSLPYQSYLKLSIGATRLEEKKVLQISCYNA